MNVPDYFTIASALNNGPSNPGRASFDVEWREPSTPAAWSRPDVTFNGFQTAARIDWSATSEGTTWKSHRSDQKIESAFVGTERNGVYR